MAISDQDLEAAILDLCAARGAGKSICPSEPARALGGDRPEGWSVLMPRVRRIAVRLMEEGRLVILRKGRPVDPRSFKGVYRLTLPSGT
jgi:hypothetical protein